MAKKKNARKGKYFESLATAVASGVTVCSAAEDLGCSVAHAYRITATPEFKTRVSEIRASLSDLALGRLTEVAAKAVDTLEEIMESREAKESDRIAAAKAVLAQLGPLAELVELRQRINELERAAAEVDDESA